MMAEICKNYKKTWQNIEFPWLNNHIRKKYIKIFCRHKYSYIFTYARIQFTVRMILSCYPSRFYDGQFWFSFTFLPHQTMALGACELMTNASSGSINNAVYFHVTLCFFLFLSLLDIYLISLISWVFLWNSNWQRISASLVCALDYQRKSALLLIFHHLGSWWKKKLKSSFQSYKWSLLITR